MTTPCRVWSKFTAKSKSGDSVFNLRIQNMPNDRFDEVLELFAMYFSTEETMHKAAGIPKNDEALSELNVFIRDWLTDSPHHITICCLDEDANTVGEIIGASIITIYSEDKTNEEDVKPKSKEVAKLFELMGDLYSLLKNVEDLDKFYDDRGVVVLPTYRGLGIAQQLLHVRRLICEDTGISMTGAWVTAIASQKACERDGWKTIYEVSYDEFGEKHGVTFENVPLTCKFMIARV